MSTTSQTNEDSTSIYDRDEEDLSVFEKDEEEAAEEEVIEMDGYDLHQVDWSVPKGMRSIEDCVARVMILYRFTKVGMAEDEHETQVLSKRLIQDLKNTPRQEAREANTRARFQMDFTLWERTSRREQLVLLQKPYQPSKLNLRARNREMIFALLWVIKAIKTIDKKNLDDPSPLEQVKNIGKLLACKDIWEMRQYANFFYRKRDELLELLEQIKTRYDELHQIYVKYVTRLKPVSNDLIERMDVLRDWYRVIEWSATLREWD